MEILFWRHQTKTQKALGNCTIYCRVTVNSVRAEIGSTNIEVPFEDFDTDRQIVFSSNPNFALYNLRLQEEYTTRILTIYTELLKNKQPITSDAIKRIFLSADTTNARLMEAIDLFLVDFKKKTIGRKNRKGENVKAKRSESTLKPLNTFRRKVLDFLIQRKEQHITLEELTNKWFFEFDDWMYDIGHEQSTIIGHLKKIKQVTAWAFSKKKLCGFDPLVGCEYEAEQPKDPNFLSEEQFQAWLKHEFSNKKLQQAADLFAVYCRTGMHYEDLKQVIKKPEEYFRKGLDGDTWIYKPREKTEVNAKVPGALINDIMHIIEKYGGWEKLPIKSNQKMNEFLKLCAIDFNIKLKQEEQYLRVYDGLSVKHGRCTLTDYWLNELGKSEDDLLPILGRKSRSGLERYGRKDERAVIKALAV